MSSWTLSVCRLMSSRVGRGSCRLLLVAALIGLAVPASFGQTSYSTGTLRGTVLDPQGASIANAALTVTNTATAVVATATSSAEGTYQFLALNPGTYDLQVVAQGFEKSVAKGLVITVGQVVVYDPHLKVGSTTVSVEVTYNSAPLIEVEQSQQANTINTQQVENLPNVSRSFTASIYTLPGVTNSNAPAIQDPNVGTGYLSSGFSIGGSTGRSNLFTIDGGEDDYGSGALRVVNVPIIITEAPTVTSTTRARMPQTFSTVSVRIRPANRSSRMQFLAVPSAGLSRKINFSFLPLLRSRSSTIRC